MYTQYTQLIVFSFISELNQANDEKSSLLVGKNLCQRLSQHGITQADERGTQVYIFYMRLRCWNQQFHYYLLQRQPGFVCSHES